MSTGIIRSTGSSGDTIVAEWDTADEASVDRARRAFDAQARYGLMVRCDDGTDLTGQKITSFDPGARDILALGAFAGG